MSVSPSSRRSTPDATQGALVQTRGLLDGASELREDLVRGRVHLVRNDDLGDQLPEE